MGIRFKPGQWPADIAAISERPEFMNAVVEIRDPTRLVRNSNIRTGEVTYTGDPVIATGPARIIGTRSVSDATDGTIYDPTSVKPLRMQIPASTYAGRINRAWQVRVLDGGRNPRLETMLLIVRSDFQSSNMASRTIELSVDVEKFANWIDGDGGGIAEGLNPASGLNPSLSLYPTLMAV